MQRITYNDIPEQLRSNPDLRFIYTAPQSKEIWKKKWSKNPYKLSELTPQIMKPGINLGVVCGWGGHLIIDVDNASLFDLVEFPETFTTQSPSGLFHYHYNLPDHEIGKVVMDLNGTHFGEVLGWGFQGLIPPSYVDMPYSPKKSKGSYTVYNDHPITVLENINFITSVFGKGTSKKSPSSLSNQQPVNNLSISDCNTPKQSGLSNKKTFRSYLNDHLNILDVLKAYKVLLPDNQNDYLNIPHPIHGSDNGKNFGVDTVKNVFCCRRHHFIGGGVLELIAMMEGITVCEHGTDEKPNPLKLNKKQYLETLKIVASKFNIKIPKGEMDRYFEIQAAESIIEKYNVIFSSGQFFLYRREKGTYHSIYDEEMLRIVLYFGNFKNSQAKAIISNIQAIAHVRQEKLNQSEFLNFKNGMYNPLTGEFREHSPKFLSTIQIPINAPTDGWNATDYLEEHENLDKEDITLYDVTPNDIISCDEETEDSSAPPIVLDTEEFHCPLWINSINEIFDEDQEKIKLVQEFFGLSFTKLTKFAKCLYLVGEGANGKSVILDTLTSMVGDDNYSSINIDQFGNDTYIAELNGKLVNVCNEIKCKSTVSDDMFKRVVTGDSVTANPKWVKPYKFNPFCKLIFAANNLPRVDDKTDGFFRRLMILEFKRQFSESEADRDLTRKLRGELEGIFKWSMVGLARLLRRGRFHETKEMRAAIEAYKRENNSIIPFIEDCLDFGDNYQIGKIELYNCYKEWCENNGFHPLSVIKFHKELMRSTLPDFGRISEVRVQNVRYWKGANIRHPELL